MFNHLSRVLSAW